MKRAMGREEGGNAVSRRDGLRNGFRGDGKIEKEAIGEVGYGD